MCKQQKAASIICVQQCRRSCSVEVPGLRRHYSANHPGLCLRSKNLNAAGWLSQNWKRLVSEIKVAQSSSKHISLKVKAWSLNTESLGADLVA